MPQITIVGTYGWTFLRSRRPEKVLARKDLPGWTFYLAIANLSDDWKQLNVGGLEEVTNGHEKVRQVS